MDEPSGMVILELPLDSIRGFLEAPSGPVGGSVEAGRLLPFIFLYCSWGSTPLTRSFFSWSMEARSPDFSEAAKSFWGEVKMPSMTVFPFTSSLRLSSKMGDEGYN